MPRYVVRFELNHHGKKIPVQINKTAPTVTALLEWLEATFQPDYILGIVETME